MQLEMDDKDNNDGDRKTRCILMGQWQVKDSERLISFNTAEVEVQARQPREAVVAPWKARPATVRPILASASLPLSMYSLTAW
jgi:hypothetical protein